MCRTAGRRCPGCSNPQREALRHAKTSVVRLTGKLDEAERTGTPERVDALVGKYSEALTRMCEREQAAAGTSVKAAEVGGLPAPAPTRAGEFGSAGAIAHMSWDEVSDLVGELNSDPDAQEALLTLIDERDEREQAERKDQAEAEQAAQWQSYPTTPASPEIASLLHSPRRQLTPHERAREEYDNYVYAQYAKCESELSFMLNKQGQAKGVDTFSLFSGSVSRAKKYGSDELQSWFAANGRHTLASYRFAMFNWNSDRKAATNVRLEGFENVAHTF